MQLHRLDEMDLTRHVATDWPHWWIEVDIAGLE